MKHRLLALLCIAVLVLGCLPLTACGKKIEKFSTHSFDYFDTATTITGYAKRVEDFDKVSDTAFGLLAAYHQLYDIYTQYEGITNLCVVNQMAGNGKPLEVDRRIIDLLVYAKEMYTLTDGQVNVAMGSVLSLWHQYRTEGMDQPTKAQLPPMKELKEAARHTNINDVVIDKDKGTVTLTDPAMRLDVGAIAKGYATERVARWLEAQGYTGYILNVGGNVRTIGSKGDGEPWTVGIENPDSTKDDYLAYLHLSGQALVTSGSYQRYYVVDGKEYHHIIHPDTLMPATGFVSVSVVCADSGQGDALSTALFCLSLKEGQKLVESLDGVEALWVSHDGSQTASAGWKTYVEKK